MAKAADTYNEVKNRLKGLKRSEKYALGAFGATVVLALVMLSLWGTRARYVPLVAGASEEEIKDVTAVLDEKGEEYRVDDGKVLVRQERKPVLAGELSRRNVVPGAKIIGFSDILDKDSFYTTRDRRRLMMQVALQNELALMIANLSAIESAKVLIKEGRQADIFGEGRPGGASVTVRTRSGTRLTDEIVESIAGIVKGAVSDIAAEDITVVDARTSVTHKPKENKTGLYEAPTVFRLKEDVERALAEKVRGMFLRMGVDAVVVVNAELDLEKVQERVQSIDPENQGSFIVSERRTKNQTSEPVRQGGVSGIEANRRLGTTVGTGGGLGGAVGVAQPTHATTESSEERDNTYTYSYLLKEITRAPKGLTKVSASVVLFDRIVEKDGTVQYDSKVIAQGMDDWNRLVANALGIDDATAVVVKHMPSAGPAPVVAAGVGVQLVAYRELASRALTAVIALAAFAGAYVLFRRYMAGHAGKEAPVPLPSGQPDRITQLQKAIADQVSQKPDRLARILARWIVSR
ncbi:MAG: hypothetical protein JW909_11230 [Planctomycetes bacterium]|nr:hypothetical protein [Planctomycetota bacterium]